MPQTKKKVVADDNYKKLDSSAEATTATKLSPTAADEADKENKLDQMEKRLEKAASARSNKYGLRNNK
jgi:hypothetical protein